MKKKKLCKRVHRFSLFDLRCVERAGKCTDSSGNSVLLMLHSFNIFTNLITATL